MQILPSLEAVNSSSADFLRSGILALESAPKRSFWDVLTGSACQDSHPASAPRSSSHGSTQGADRESFTHPADVSGQEVRKGAENMERKTGSGARALSSDKQEVQENSPCVVDGSEQKGETGVGAVQEVKRGQEGENRKEGNDLCVEKESSLTELKQVILGLGGGPAELEALDHRFKEQGFIDFAYLLSLAAQLRHKQDDQSSAQQAVQDGTQLAIQLAKLAVPFMEETQDLSGAQKAALQEIVGACFSGAAAKEGFKLEKALLAWQDNPLSRQDTSWESLARFLQDRGVEKSQLEALSVFLCVSEQGETFKPDTLTRLTDLVQEISSGVKKNAFSVLTKAGEGMAGVKAFREQGKGLASGSGKQQDGSGQGNNLNADQQDLQRNFVQSPEELKQVEPESPGKSALRSGSLHVLSKDVSQGSGTLAGVENHHKIDTGQVLVKGGQDVVSSQLGGVAEQGMRAGNHVQELLSDTKVRAGLLKQVESGIYRNYGQGRQEISIKIHPPELGRLDLVLQVQDKALTAVIKTTDPDVAKVIQHNLNLLQQGLEQQGIKVHKIDVQTQLAQDQGFQQWFGEHGHNQAYDEQKKMHQGRLQGNWITDAAQTAPGLLTEVREMGQNGLGGGVSILI